MKIGEKRKYISSTTPNKRLKRRPSGGDDEVDRVSFSGGSDSDDGGDGDGDEWIGIGDGEDREFEQARMQE